MTDPLSILTEQMGQTDWAKDRQLVRKGFRDLAYLPKGRCEWNMTLAALAFAARRLAREHLKHHSPAATDLNLWTIMHGAPSSARYAELGQDALVLWHGTSAVRASKIRQHGLAHKRGVWAATDPSIAHGFTRGRSRAFAAGSAMIVLVLSRSEWDARASCTPTVACFHESLPPEHIEYILWPDRIEFVGPGKARAAKPWGAAHFKKSRGRWVPRSKPPVRLDARRTYRSFDEWLDLSVQRIVTTLGTAAAIEIFSSLYATIDPWQALEHKQVFDAIDRLCRPVRLIGQVTFFSLAGG